MATRTALRKITGDRQEIESPGCGEKNPFGDKVCSLHVDVIDFDGFTVKWHVHPEPTGPSPAHVRSWTMWRRDTDADYDFVAH